MYDDAIAEFRRAETALRGWPVVMAAIGHVQGAAGRRAEARETLGALMRLTAERYVTPYGVALVHAGLGENDQALAWLHRALQDRSHWLVWVTLDPRLDALRSDPWYGDLLQNIGRVTSPSAAWGASRRPGESAAASSLWMSRHDAR